MYMYIIIKSLTQCSPLIIGFEVFTDIINYIIVYINLYKMDVESFFILLLYKSIIFSNPEVI